MNSASWLAALLLPFAFAQAAEVPLQLDPAHSRVDIVVKATVDSFVGTLENYDANIRVDAATGEVRAADFAFHFTDVKTGNADRDEQMNEWQDTARHPDGAFHLATLTRGTHGGLLAAGTLTLHNVARELTFPVSVTHDGELYAIDGEATLDTRDFGLPVIKKFLLLKVDPSVKVRFHLQGRAKAGDIHASL
ncbi:MAG: YceI family protein [Opitutaceae bacterium]|jgi:polyisoprenoid-binding protein YceI|nr:YceI family protein [Opitutaceae bacterium]